MTTWITCDQAHFKKRIQNLYVQRGCHKLDEERCTYGVLKRGIIVFPPGFKHNSLHLGKVKLDCAS